ncbi:MAG: UDP-N-acetylmuramate dehydrogenase [Cyanobacteria bacterium SIG31]|nr:UDP-N-acetylmuramate dehydrogenase [Cyanobacteria bacterium SIG31]
MQVEFRENYEIKKHTTYKIGGMVSKVWFPKTQQELVFLLKDLKDYVLLGNCSNILFSSNGYKGNVILTTEMRHYEINGSRIIADCGVKGPLLAQKTCDASLSGFEFMIGFPGSIGGEIYMNASCHGQAISDTLVRCCLFDKDKKEIVYKEKSEMGFGYRKSCLQDGKYILLGAEFELKKSNKEEIETLINRNLGFRKDVQPSLANPNAGSVFKNPENDSAGRLLDKAGVKSLEFENVKVWDKHANFIVNKGSATSVDVLELMVKMFTAVKENYRIELSPEIIFIGDKSKKEEELCKILYQKKQK